MVVRSSSDDRADRLFRALADPTRREIVSLTMAEAYSVTDLASRFPTSFAAVQKHVAVLEGAGLVTKQRQGREQRVRGNPDALQEAHRALDRLAAVWQGRVGRIDALLAAPTSPEPKSPPESKGPPDPKSPPDPKGPPDSEESAHAGDRRPKGP